MAESQRPRDPSVGGPPTDRPVVRVHRVPDFVRPTGGPFGPGKKKKKRPGPKPGAGRVSEGSGRYEPAAAATGKRFPGAQGAAKVAGSDRSGGAGKFTRTKTAKVKPGKAARVATTDWADAAEWYDQLVGDDGSEYHREVVIPGTLRLLGEVSGRRVLDVACGQGVLSRALYSAGATVVGVDAAEPLIDAARRRDADLTPSATPRPEYRVGDATTLSCVPETDFDLAACVLAIQDLHPHGPVFEQVARRLRPAVSDGAGGWVGGRFVVVMMHPAFRSPKASRWGWDRVESVQFRRVDRYLTPRKEPIVTHPGASSSRYTWSFHRPIGEYVSAARKAGLLVDALEEWPSHKVSDSGPRAAAENLARKEIPLFLALRCVKVAPWAGDDAGRGDGAGGTPAGPLPGTVWEGDGVVIERGGFNSGRTPGP